MRVLVKNRLNTLVAVLALALGVGVNASIFTSVNSIILHPMPYPNLYRIMTIWGSARGSGGERDLMASGDFADLKSQSTALEHLAAFEQRDMALTGNGQPEEMLGCSVTGGFFQVFGMVPLRGRTFASSESEDTGTVVVSESFWRGHMGAAADAIGKTMMLAGERRTVIGIMPDAFDFPLSTDVWLPARLGPAERHEHTMHRWAAVGLLRAGATLDQARSETTAVAARLAQQYPNSDGERGLLLAPLRSLTEGTTNRFLWTLLAAAGFVLLLACANVGNLQLAKAVGRQKEITVRAALGATRLQIARALVAESLLLSLAGGLAGLTLTSWNNTAVRAGIPVAAFRAVPGLRHMDVDFTVILLTLAVSVLAGLFCSVPAIFQLTRDRRADNLADALRERVQDSGGGGAAGRRMQSGLVAFELAGALVLLVGAGLMSETFANLLNRYQGFDPKNVLTMRVSLPETTFDSGDRVAGFLTRSLESLGSVPGVEAASLSSAGETVTQMAVEGRPELRPDEPRPDLISVSSRYLETMRVPLYEGRFIARSDGSDTSPVVVLSAAVAQRYWPKGEAIGHRIRLNGEPHWLTVVGVTGDVINDWFSGQHALTAYVPYTQAPGRAAKFQLRTLGDPRLAAGPARANMRRLDKDLPVYEIQTLQEQMRQERGGVEAAASMMTNCAAVALLLAVTGLYAVLSFAVTARTHEIGVRMAVGARGLDVMKMTMGQTGRLVALGLAFGMPLAIVLAKGMSAALFGVIALRWTTFVVDAALLVAAAVLATWFPSRRASRIDPMVALRDE